MIGGGNEAARLYIEVKADTDAAQRGLKAVDRAVDNTAQTVRRTNPILQGIGQGFGISLAGLAMDAGRAVLDFGADAIRMASDVAESQSKVNVVFGTSARVIDEFADRSARSIGLSRGAALEATGTFGNLFKTIGLGEPAAADMSKALVELGADLASFNNIPVDQALLKLRSGLAGEVEPMRTLGVFLNEATVQAKAMAMGLDDASGELSEAAKIQARYALILEQTATAQGDFARTSDQAANQQRILDAQLANTQAELGQKLIPAWIELQRVMLRALDSTTVPLEELEAAAARGSQGAAAHFRQLEAVAGELGVSIERAWQLSNDAGTMSVEVLRAIVKAQAAELLELKNSGTDMSTAARAAWARVAAASEAGAAAGADAAQRTARNNLDIVASFTDMRNQLSGMASDAADSIYGPLIAKGQLAATEREIAEQREIVAAQESTKAQIADAKLRITELSATKIEQLALLASYGDQAAAQALLNNATITDALLTGTEEQKAAIMRLRAELERARVDAMQLAGALGGGGDWVIGPGGVSGHRAAGGPVRKDDVYLVGEEGPEVFVPTSGGTILPNEALAGAGDRSEMQVPAMVADYGAGWTSGGGMGGGTTIQHITVVFEQPVFDPYGDFADRLAEALQPALARASTRASA